MYIRFLLKERRKCILNHVCQVNVCARSGYSQDDAKSRSAPHRAHDGGGCTCICKRCGETSWLTCDCLATRVLVLRAWERRARGGRLARGGLDAARVVDVLAVVGAGAYQSAPATAAAARHNSSMPSGRGADTCADTTCRAASGGGADTDTGTTGVGASGARRALSDIRMLAAGIVDGASERAGATAVLLIRGGALVRWCVGALGWICGRAGQGWAGQGGSYCCASFSHSTARGSVWNEMCAMQRCAERRMCLQHQMDSDGRVSLFGLHCISLHCDRTER